MTPVIYIIPTDRRNILVPQYPESSLERREASMLRPLGDRVLVKAEKEEEKTKGGIVLPDTAQEKPQQGKVIAVGPGEVLEDGKTVPLEVKKGDKVIFSKYGGTEVKDKDEEYLILKESDILAILE